MARGFALGAFFSTLLLSCPLFLLAQTQAGVAITVKVAFTDERPVSHQVKVELYTGGGNFVNQAFTDSSGTAYFRGVANGTYQLKVSGQDAEDTTGPIFMIQRGEFNHFEFVKVRRLAGVAVEVPGPPPGLVDVSELNVPKDARKSFDKGMEAFREKKLDQALQQLQKAISTHPNYASAYNLIGMTYMRQGNVEQGRAAFEKALTINDNFALASRNLAKVYCNEEKLDTCESFLEKSAASDPRSAETFTILAQVEFMKKKYQEASVSARRVHELPHKEYAVAHLVAARSLRALSQNQAAVEEYKLFLKESPAGGSSPQAREELAQIEGQQP